MNSRYIYILMYFIGLAVFGFLYWLLNGVLTIIRATGIQDSTTFSSTDQLMTYLWFGIVVIYLLFGGYWLVRLFNQDVQTGGGVIR